MPASKKISQATPIGLPLTVAESSEVCGRACDLLHEHQHVHEMILALADLVEAAEANGLQPDHTALWPGLAVVMKRLSADTDDVAAALSHWQTRALEAHAVGADRLAGGAR